MTGFEVVGVVLGVLPLLSSTIGTYDNVYRPFITQYKDYEPALKGFQQGLLTERTIFRYDCIMLLRSSVGSEWVQDMLENLQHDRWRDEDIEEKVSQHLGSSKEACEAAIARIQGKLSAILKEYQRYGITTNSESLNNNVSPSSMVLLSYENRLTMFISLVILNTFTGNLNFAGLRDDWTKNFKI